MKTKPYISKVTIALALLLSTGLPLFESCKPKDETNTVLPDPASYKPGDLGFFNAQIKVVETNKNVGLLVLDISYDKPARKCELQGRYFQFKTTNFTGIEAVLKLATQALTTNDPNLPQYVTMTNFLEKQLEKVPNYVRAFDVKPEIVAQLVTGKTKEFSAGLVPVHQPDTWYATLEKILWNLVATPTYAQQTVGEKVHMDTIQWIEAHSEYPSPAQIRQFEENARAKGYPEINEWASRRRAGFPLTTAGQTTTQTVQGPSLNPNTQPGLWESITQGTAELSASIGGAWENIRSRIEDIRKKIDELFSAINPNNPNTTTSQSTSQSAHSSGDPHLVTFDGFKYDFQAVGEFVVAKSTEDNFEIQIRQSNLTTNTSVSFNSGIAINTGADIVSITKQKTSWTLDLYVNQKKIADNTLSVELQNGGKLWYSGGGIYVTTPQKDVITISSRMAINIQPAESRKGKLNGIYGSFDGNANNDMQTRDGQPINPKVFDDLYKKFADSWRITQDKSLFVYEAGTNTETFTDRKKPTDYHTLLSLDATKRIEAATICRQAGVTREPELSGCIVDVATTGDKSWADIAAQSQRILYSKSIFRPQTFFPGDAREVAACLTIGTKIYVGLGQQSSKIYADWWEFDPANDKWTRKADFPLPKGRSGFAGFVADGKAYIVAGYDGAKDFNDTWQYDPATDKWTQKKDLNGPTRYCPIGASANGKGYVLFGVKNFGWGILATDYYNTVHQYDPTTDTWTLTGQFPGEPRGRNVNNKIHNALVFSGIDQFFVGDKSNKLYQYQPQTNTWVLKKGGGSVNQNQTCVVIGKKGYAFGSFGILWEYDFDKDAWTQTDNEFAGFTDQKAAAVGNKIIFGLGYLGTLAYQKDWWQLSL